MSKLTAAAVLFAGVWLCYLPGNIGCADSMWSIPTAVSLLDHGDRDLDEYLPLLQGHGFPFIDRAGGHYYTIYPVGTSLMALPAVALLRPAGRIVERRAPALWQWIVSVEHDRGGCPPVDAEPVIAVRSLVEHLIASALVSLVAVVIFLIAADGLPVPAALAVALVFALATSAWSSASRTLWQHGPSMLVLALALWQQLRGGPAAWIGLLLGFSYVIRPTNVIPFVGAGGWFLLTRPRELPAFLAGAGVALVPFALMNRSAYHAWLPPYYTPGFYSRNAFKGEALAGLLVSPNRGLFVFTPVLAVALVGMAMKAAARRATLLDVSLAGCIAVHWIAISTTNGNWWGGASYGPRLFTDLLPYFMYFTLPVVAWILAARGRARLLAASAFALCAALSAVMHAQGALNPAALAWNAYPTPIDFDPIRVWDWRHPQFLAGLTFVPTPAPPVDLEAVACTEPPGAPGAPTIASNGGGTVVLQWMPAPGSVAVYLMDVGSRPGSADLPPRESRDVVHPSVVAHRVPPGTYYVRVHGRNRCGDGPSSPEVSVTVK